MKGLDQKAPGRLNEAGILKAAGKVVRGKPGRA